MKQGFDPFLRELEGAEVATDTASMERALRFLTAKELVVASGDGRLEVGFLQDPRHLEFQRCPFFPGSDLALSDHQGIHYVGVRVRAAHQLGEVLFLEPPQMAVFFPGRRQLRLDGALGAQAILECENELIPARAIDLSMGGMGLRIALGEYQIAQELIIHLQIREQSFSLPAQIRNVRRDEEEIRLGLQFGIHSEALSSMIREAVRGL